MWHCYKTTSIIELSHVTKSGYFQEHSPSDGHGRYGLEIVKGPRLESSRLSNLRGLLQESAVMMHILFTDNHIIVTKDP